MIAFFHTHFPILLSFFLSEVNERFFMFLLVSQWWERDQQQVQPVRPGKLSEAHSCLKQRDTFNLLCSYIRSQIHSWRDGVSGWKSGCMTHGQFPCAYEDAELLGDYDWAGLHTVLSVCLLDLVGDAQSTSCAPQSVSQKSRAKEIPWSQPECSAGAAQVTECFHLTVGFEGNVPKCCDSSIQTVETKAGMEGWGYFGKVLLWSSKSLDNKAYRQKHWININWRLYVSLQSTNPCLVFAHCMPSAVWEHPWTES